MTWAFDVAARTLWQEARGEPIEGQIAVAWVIKNRLAYGRWGKSLASVCLWRAQFSGWYVPTDPNFSAVCSLADDDTTLIAMGNILQSVMDSQTDPTDGAMYYYAESIPEPSWAGTMIFCVQLGHQKFYKPRPQN